MLLSKVKSMTPLNRLVYFITEREAIRLKKEAGEPKPWTSDPILQQYRFCNVRRMDDKVSKCEECLEQRSQVRHWFCEETLQLVVSRESDQVS